MGRQVLSIEAENFLQAMDKAGKDLQSFSQEINNRSEQISLTMDDFKKKADSALVGSEKLQDTPNAVEAAMHNALDMIRTELGGWYEAIKKSQKGRKFMNDHEKHLVVMAFGAVKAGKSKLGNFIAGREWLSAEFDNEYKHCPPTEFATQEKGRDTGDIEKVAGRTWFKEGVTDTTGDIQFFTLSGLRWFDSPGTGAVEMAGDKRNMEEMVNDYLQYVDLCIFLINSSEPGLMEDMKYINRLSRTGQEALIVITKSDMINEDFDSAGNLIKIVVPKSDETRKLQEDDMCKRLKAEYSEISDERYRAMSISVKLAEQAILNQNVDMLQASNLPELLSRLSTKATNDVVELKAKGPRNAINKLINDIIEGDETTKGIDVLEAGFHKVKIQVKDYRDKINNRVARICDNIVRIVKTKTQVRLYEISEGIRQNGNSAETKDIAEVLFEITNPLIKAEINKEIGRIIGQAQEDYMKNIFLNDNSGTLKVKEITQSTRTIQNSYEVEFCNIREPAGLWEHVRGVFGHKYYSRGTTINQTQETIVTGTNIEEVLKDILPQIKEYAQREAEHALDEIAASYFAPQERIANDILQCIGDLKDQLEKLKY